MNAKEAVAARILALCDERGIAINALASSSGVAPSTVYSMLNAKSQNPGAPDFYLLNNDYEPDSPPASSS